MKADEPVVVVGEVVQKPADGTAQYVAITSGVHASYFVRSDGAIDRFQGGVVIERIACKKAKYIAASAGLFSSYFLREDGVIDRFKGPAGVSDSIVPADHPKITYVAVSNSAGPCYALRSDDSVDLLRSGDGEEATSTMDTGPYKQIAGGTDVSYHLKKDGTVDKIFAFGKVSHTFPCPSDTQYVAVSGQGISAKNDKGGGGASSVYFIRADGKVDRAYCHRTVIDLTMDPPEGIQYKAISSQDSSSYLLRSDGAVDRTTGGGKISNTMNPPPGGAYVAVSAGQWASYFLRSDGKVDRTTGWGKVSATISPDVEPNPSGAKKCAVM
jgi:hypothetical protein